MSVYFSQPCPIPYHIIHPQFFLFFSKKLHNALWKIAHIGRKYFLPLIQAQASYFIFHGEHSMNHSLILKIFSLLPPGYMRRAWHWFEAGYNETKQLYHSTNCISLYFLIHRKYTIWNLEAGFWLVFCPWCFVEGMKLNLGRVSEAWSIFWILNLVGTADFEVDARSRLWRWSRFVFELVIWPLT